MSDHGKQDAKMGNGQGDQAEAAPETTGLGSKILRLCGAGLIGSVVGVGLGYFVLLLMYLFNLLAQS